MSALAPVLRGGLQVPTVLRGGLQVPTVVRSGLQVPRVGSDPEASRVDRKSVV